MCVLSRLQVTPPRAAEYLLFCFYPPNQPASSTCFLPAVAMMEVEACRVLPGQMVQTISVDVGDAAAVEKAMGDAVAKQGAVQVGSFGLRP